jgi:hypothetical protein
MIALFGVVVDCGAQVLKVALGAAALSLVGFTLALSAGHVLATEGAGYIVQRLATEKLQESPRPLCGFFGPRLIPGHVLHVD